MAQKEIVKILQNRENPAGNPCTFISCTNEDDQVEWMKEAEELVPYCSESDDFKDEMTEVLRDQGEALPYSKGFHLVCQLVAAMNPDDLDALDESVPFTKTTLDNILGIQSNEESYRHYFNKVNKMNFIMCDAVNATRAHNMYLKICFLTHINATNSSKRRNANVLSKAEPINSKRVCSGTIKSF